MAPRKPKNTPKPATAAGVSAADRLLGPPETWPTDKTPRWPRPRVTPSTKNARPPPASQIAILAQILRRRGPDQPIVVDEKGIILKGHGRRLAALEAGMREFPVVQRMGLTEQENNEIRLEDNALPLLSGWDPDLLRAHLRRGSAGQAQER